MIQPLVTGPRGEAAVVTFDHEIKWLQDFTGDDKKIRQAVKGLKAADSYSARMFDAVAEASDRLRQRPGRKVLLLISEGRDSGSETKFQQAVETVEREGIEVFGARYSAYAMSWISRPEDFPEQRDLNQMFFNQLLRLGATNHVKALTLATGGSGFPFVKERGMENAMVKLGEEVHTQYVLSFPQRDGAPGLHEIEVFLPGRGDLRVRVRRNYWADQTWNGP